MSIETPTYPPSRFFFVGSCVGKSLLIQIIPQYFFPQRRSIIFNEILCQNFKMMNLSNNKSLSYLNISNQSVAKLLLKSTVTLNSKEPQWTRIKKIGLIAISLVLLIGAGFALLLYFNVIPNHFFASKSAENSQSLAHPEDKNQIEQFAVGYEIIGRENISDGRLNVVAGQKILHLKIKVSLEEALKLWPQEAVF
jgi:hypothetical protein